MGSYFDLKKDRHPASTLSLTVRIRGIDLKKTAIGEVQLLKCSISMFLQKGQEATIRTGHGTTDWFQIGKGVCQGCILSSCLFNLYAEYIMRNAGLEESQAGIKIAGRNISNL